MTYRLEQLYLVVLELVVGALLVSLLFADLPALDDYMPFMQYGLFLLSLVLLISVFRMFSEHRFLGLAGLGLIGFMLVLYLSGLVLSSRR